MPLCNCKWADVQSPQRRKTSWQTEIRSKYEVADELGVPLSDGYNGNLTAKQNGSVGGYMVKKMIEAQEKQMAGRSADMQ